MHLYFNNVNDAFMGMVKGFQFGAFLSPYPLPSSCNSYHPPITKTLTRAGTCLSIEEPVTITYLNPTRRVLFGSGRDANPFFHMIEALWMLAGRNDIKHLECYNSRVGEFSDDGQTWYGAYGHRWRHCLLPPKWDRYEQDSIECSFDQIERTIRLLKSNPTNRRIVMTMWLPTDYERVEEMPDCKDVPCNTEVMFRCRKVRGDLCPDAQELGSDPTLIYYLDMTVINRSNDMVWGTLGSNYVTFSILQEYIACSLGWEVGHYHQVSNNQHVYVDSPGTNNFNPERLLEGAANYYTFDDCIPPRIRPGYTSQRIFAPGEAGKLLFDNDIKHLFDSTARNHKLLVPSTPFLLHTVRPMLNAWAEHKNRNYDIAQQFANKIQADDWRLACQQWLQRRAEKYLSSDQKATNVQL